MSTPVEPAANTVYLPSTLTEPQSYGTRSREQVPIKRGYNLWHADMTGQVYNQNAA